MRTKRAKKMKFYVWKKKKDHWVWTVVKNGVIECKIYLKRGSINRQMISTDILEPRDWSAHGNWVCSTDKPVSNYDNANGDIDDNIVTPNEQNR